MKYNDYKFMTISSGRRNNVVKEETTSVVVVVLIRLHFTLTFDYKNP
jgi:hypothetical protein